LGDPVLRLKARRVTKIDESIRRLVQDMIESMYAAHGVGLAAPQIGVPLRVIVIGLPDEEPFALINPEIVKREGQRLVDEGCLSIPGYRAEVPRSLTVVARGMDLEGRTVRIKASAKRGDEREALLAQALEHEVDHINGILYIDRLESLDRLVKIGEGR
jgi:peptide deformylase